MNSDYSDDFFESKILSQIKMLSSEAARNGKLVELTNAYLVLPLDTEESCRHFYWKLGQKNYLQVLWMMH